jgi:hypothetical protein
VTVSSSESSTRRMDPKKGKRPGEESPLHRRRSSMITTRASLHYRQSCSLTCLPITHSTTTTFSSYATPLPTHEDLNQIRDIHWHLIDLRGVVLLNIAKKSDIIIFHKINCNTFTTKSSRTTNAMNVKFSV